MLFTRTLTLVCSAIMTLLFILIIVIWLISGDYKSVEYVEKIPAIKQFINSKSRKYTKSKDGDDDAVCSICLQCFADDPSKMITELCCNSKHKFH